MELDFNQISFSVSINGCYDEILDKLEQLSVIEMQFLRRFENKLNDQSTCASMIFYIRNILQKNEQMFEDVKSYFDDIKIPFIFDFFRKIYSMVIMGYNFTAEAFIQMMNNAVKKQKKEQQCPLKSIKKMQKRKSSGFKKLEEFDYTIKTIEDEEEQLFTQMMEMFNSTMSQRSVIQRLKPSCAANQLIQVKQSIERVLGRTQHIFQQAYMLKYQQNRQQMKKFNKPQDISQSFKSQMTSSMKDKFLEGMQRAIYKIKQKYGIGNLCQKRQQKQTQTEQSKEGLKQKEKKIKVRNNQKLQLLCDIQVLKKLQLQTAKDNANLVEKCEEYQLQFISLRGKYDDLTRLYHEKRTQYDNTSMDLTWALAQQEKISQKLQRQILMIKTYKLKIDMGIQAHINTQKQTVQTQTEIDFLLDDSQNEVIKLLKANNSKIITRLAQKQSKIKQLQKNIKSSSNLKLLLNQIVKNCSNDEEQQKTNLHSQLFLQKIESIVYEIKNNKSFTQFDHDKQSQTKSNQQQNKQSQNIISTEEIPITRYQKKRKSQRFPKMKCLNTKKNNLKPGFTEQRRLSFVYNVSISTQTQFIQQNKLSKIMKEFINLKSVQVQTQTIQLKLGSKHKAGKKDKNIMMKSQEKFKRLNPNESRRYNIHKPGNQSKSKINSHILKSSQTKKNNKQNDLSNTLSDSLYKTQRKKFHCANPRIQTDGDDNNTKNKTYRNPIYQFEKLQIGQFQANTFYHKSSMKDIDNCKFTLSPFKYNRDSKQTIFNLQEQISSERPKTNLINIRSLRNHQGDQMIKNISKKKLSNNINIKVRFIESTQIN